MTKAQEAKVRRALIEVDQKILQLILEERSMHDAAAAKLVLYEATRNALQSLLLGVEGAAAG